MVSVVRPGKAICTSVFAFPVGIDRPIKGDVGGLIECENGFRMLFGHRGAKFRRGPIKRLHRIAPIAIAYALGQAKSLRNIGRLCAATELWNVELALRT